MTRHNAGAYILFAILGVAVVALLIYAFTNTIIVANAYNQRMQRAVANVSKAFAVLEKTTNYHIIEDPSASADVINKEKMLTQSAIQNSRTALNDLAESSVTLDTLFYGGFIDLYDRATVLRRDAIEVLSQSSDAVKRYEHLLHLLDTFISARDAYKAQLDAFNSIEYFDSYAGRGADMRAAATIIRDTVARLAKSTVNLPELSSSWADIIAIMNRTADDFDSLAYGLDVAIDAYIYDAASKIESDESEFEGAIQKLHATIAQKSRTIKDISDLSEKLEPLNVSISNQE